MKKIVIKLNFQDVKVKQKPMQAISSIEGIVSMSLDGEKITVIGDVDPVQVVKKLQKWFPKIDTVGPAKEEKKEDNKAAGGGGADKKPASGGEKKEADKKKEAEEEMARMLLAYHQMNYNPHLNSQPYYVNNYEENPNSCVIC